MTAVAPPDRSARRGDAGVLDSYTVRRGVIAGVVGNMLEWYDFAVGSP